MKYQEWLIKWLENYIQHSLKQRTYTLYGKIVYQHIIPEIGNIDNLKLRLFCFKDL